MYDENVKMAFNDPASSVRILVATDAASEGLNLHRTARYLLHSDCTWNPSRLKRRNGRLGRYGQSRDVTVHHFVSNADLDLRFLDHVIRKAAEVREDLGSVLSRRSFRGVALDGTAGWRARGGADAVVLLSIEELGVNVLRETFHRWVRTVALPVRDGELGLQLPHVPARSRRGACEVDDWDQRERAGEIVEEVSARLRAWLREYRDALTRRLASQLRVDGEAARGREDERYRQRQGEVSALIERSTLARLTREVEQLRDRARQGQLFDEADHLAEMERSIKEKQEELARRQRHYEEVRGQLQRGAYPHPGASPARTIRNGRRGAGVSRGPGGPGCRTDGRRAEPVGGEGDPQRLVMVSRPYGNGFGDCHGPADRDGRPSRLTHGTDSRRSARVPASA